MDNLDNFVTKTKAQMKAKKIEDNKKAKRERSCSSMEYSEYYKNWGPPTPVFKPLNSPNDLPPEMLLPPSELSDLTEEDYRKALSCPSELTVLVEESEYVETDEFVMLEESTVSERTVGSSETIDNPSSNEHSNVQSNSTSTHKSPKIPTREGSNLGIIMKTTTQPQQQQQPDKSSTSYCKRIRSQSENLTCYSIFQFMENKLSNHKDSSIN